MILEFYFSATCNAIVPCMYTSNLFISFKGRKPIRQCRRPLKRYGKVVLCKRRRRCPRGYRCRRGVCCREYNYRCVMRNVDHYKLFPHVLLFSLILNNCFVTN